MPDIRNNRLFSFLRWLLLVAAYVYLGWKLWHFKEYDIILSILSSADWLSYAAFLFALLLMPLNLLSEAVRWRLLLSRIEPFSLKQSLHQVVGGLTGAFLTPFRAGEIPARLVYMPLQNNWKQALAAGISGGVLMTLVITLLGIFPIGRLLSYEQTYSVWRYIVFTIVTGAGCLLAIRYLSKHYSVWQGLRIPFARVTFWTGIRYLCFSLQFVLMLYAVGIRLSRGDLLIAIPSYYLLVTLTPNMPAADAGIRGSWAVFVFSLFTDAYPLAAIAAIGMWIINTLLPLCSLILPKWQKRISGTTIDK